MPASKGRISVARSTVHAALIILALVFGSAPRAAEAQTGTSVVVTLRDGLSGQTLAAQKVTARERLADGTTLAIATKTTDAAGKATFSLAGIGVNRTYFLTAKPYNGATATSVNLSGPGQFAFLVGTLRATVMSGAGDPMIGVVVSARERLADGSTVSASSGTTDASGVIRFTLPGLGAGRTYHLEANSPVDGIKRRSSPLAANGLFTFVVGNAPLRVSLFNAYSFAPLAGVRVNAYERLADGSRVFRSARTTDDAGRVAFDLDGLGDGRVYLLGTNPHATGTAYSADLRSPGELDFPVGTFEVTAVHPVDQTPLPGLLVTVKQKRADGSLRYVTKGTTGDGGIVRFDIAGLGAGRTVVLEATSPLDGSIKRSREFSAPGQYLFPVGSDPLVVTLRDALTGAVLPDLWVEAYEILGPENHRWANGQSTDSAGRLVFDLDGLGAGRTYFLHCHPFDGGEADSEPITQSGSFEFSVGNLEVTMVSGFTGLPLARQWIAAVEVMPDGEWEWRRWTETDDNGVVRLDLSGLGGGRKYILKSESPIDGSHKYSQEIAQPGRFTFVVGNAPLQVTLIDALTGAALPGVDVTAYEIVPDGEPRWATWGTTDTNGGVVFDLDGLGDGRSYFLYTRPFDGSDVESEPISEPGPFELRAGNLEVTMLSGFTGQPLARQWIAAIEVLPDGEWQWKRWAESDDSGVVRFDLPGLSAGGKYVLKTESPIDGSHKYSEEIGDAGRFTFVVGNAPLNVTVADGISGTALPEIEVTVYEVLADGETRWTTWGKTDANGFLVFDLDGLGDGRIYALHTCPFDTYVHSDPLDAPGTVTLRVGTVPVTLIDGDNDLPLPDREITAWEKLPNGELRWANWGRTDATGTVRFDLEGVSHTTVVEGADPPAPSGRIYVFETHDPFRADDCEPYFSPLVDQEGAVEFRITRDGEYPLDLVPPTVTITRPANGGNVDVIGFSVTGSGADDATLSEVRVTVSDPLVGDTQGSAAYDSLTQQWSFPVRTSMVTLGQMVTITARAYDQARNWTEASVDVFAMADAAPPAVVFTSHGDGDEVEKTGFLLSGIATDDIEVAALRADVIDPILGVTVAAQVVDVNPLDGTWTLAVLNGQISEGQTISVALTAVDRRGNASTASLSLVVVGVDFEGYHLISRITFGATPALRAEVSSIGADAFLNQQLDPDAIDDSQLDALLAGLPTPDTNEELQVYEVLQAIHSRRQLREVMTQFWDNHFNTDVNKHRVIAYELGENDAFRQLSLGRFRDLLGMSAMSPAMLIYLDNAMSLSGVPNENYARELMELHSLGVDGGYTQRDVEEVARAFTGWQVQNGQFSFNPAEHDSGQKAVLGRVLPAGRGIEDGEQVLDILAAHPSTARFLCTKLSRLFIADTPPAALVQRCADTFLASGGDMTATVRGILRSPEFGDARYFRAKIKTPLEFVAGVVRNLSAATTATDLLPYMRDMGMRLFENPVPTGYSETGDDWLNSNLLVQRIQYVHAIAGNPPGAGRTSVALRSFFTGAGYTTADGVVGFLFHLVFHNDYSAIDREVAIDILTSDGSETFDITAPQAETRLRRLVATVLSYPGYQFQ